MGTKGTTSDIPFLESGRLGKLAGVTPDTVGNSASSEGLRVAIEEHVADQKVPLLHGAHWLENKIKKGYDILPHGKSYLWSKLGEGKICQSFCV